jgi:hypothetical protein
VAELVNLQRRRKQKARAAAEATAAENRARHGRPKTDRALDEAEAARRRAALDHRKLTET